jgi:hypothetical protein
MGEGGDPSVKNELLYYKIKPQTHKKNGHQLECPVVWVASIKHRHHASKQTSGLQQAV